MDATWGTDDYVASLFNKFLQIGLRGGGGGGDKVQEGVRRGFGRGASFVFRYPAASVAVGVLTLAVPSPPKQRSTFVPSLLLANFSMTPWTCLASSLVGTTMRAEISVLRQGEVRRLRSSKVGIV